jgi:hypothetical protein
VKWWCVADWLQPATHACDSLSAGTPTDAVTAVTAVTAVPAVPAVTQLARVMRTVGARATVGDVIAVIVAKVALSLAPLLP